MKYKSLLLILFLGLSFYAQSYSQTGQKAGSSIFCRNKKEVRTLRVEKDSIGKCNAIYTKFGKDQSIGQTSSEASCLEIIRKVRVTLESADWKCRDVQESRVSNLIEM